MHQHKNYQLPPQLQTRVQTHNKQLLRFLEGNNTKTCTLPSPFQQQGQLKTGSHYSMCFHTTGTQQHNQLSYPTYTLHMQLPVAAAAS